MKKSIPALPPDQDRHGYIILLEMSCVMFIVESFPGIFKRLFKSF